MLIPFHFRGGSARSSFSAFAQRVATLWVADGSLEMAWACLHCCSTGPRLRSNRCSTVTVKVHFRLQISREERASKSSGSFPVRLELHRISYIGIIEVQVHKPAVQEVVVVTDIDRHTAHAEVCRRSRVAIG
jgi:hypothetical protein